ncbi:MAG TPA: multicopper oxidase domain-containing protein [Thermoanaerobaculia bacterium]|jgi:FtsP/CotA-like multicopper oxidase with cupredoxin domain|nr:multicopper oxidase domain-containing protein [Thermoanaerobaculia bacterium]
MTPSNAARVTLALVLVAISALVLAPAARAANPQIVTCPPLQQNLITIPEIKRSSDGKLRATIELVDGMRTLWDYPNTNRCATQHLRYLRGYAGFDPAGSPAWPSGQEPLPGPTLRARVGDLVEIAFFNDIDTQNFQNALDKGAVGTTAACDQYTTSTSASQSATGPAGNSAGANDTMPNCLHGSSTSNLHFHGTHTTPSTTGDDVLLFVRPSMRVDGQRQPNRAEANLAFAEVFDRCEHHGPPHLWSEMPESWQETQKDLLQSYDRTVAYQGQPGTLPASSQLWPANASAIAQGLWPQYQVGAFPYCFPLPEWKQGSPTPRMGQAPGTHWYHAHKHGSTALNVANGLTGTLIIEGQYDDQLRAYYKNKLKEQVLMIQQLGTAPFPLTNPAVNQGAPGAPRPALSVNGRLDPVVTMAPGEVQLWRIVNGAFRDAVELYYFEPQSSSTPCSAAQPPASFPIQWRQIAQDGVQLRVENYRAVGAVDAALNIGPANRADMLIKATTAGKYSLCVVRNDALFTQGSTGAPDPPSLLLTVNVTGMNIDPPMDFIPDADFPTFPGFLDDIPASEIKLTRTLVFGAGNSTIDGKSFMDHHVDQTMQLNSAEEWTVMNQADDKSHPFHIHINPFQITGIFQPNTPEAKDPNNPCYVNPNDPATWKPCPSQQPQAPFVWWDTFPIPTGQQIQLPCKKLADCEPKLQPYITCNAARGTCTEYIPGWFKLRTRFVDFTGQYVLHCHILIHEDRGMMQLIQVVPDTTPLGHH